MSRNEPTDHPPGLQVLDLRFGYEVKTPVIDGYSLTVPRGSVHCVLGSSGGGKTTLLRLIAGLERADAGHIRIDGEEFSGPGAHHPPERRPVGMVFQDSVLLRGLARTGRLALQV